MEKYKITSPRLDELKRKKAKLEDEIQREHARLVNAKTADLCAEMAAKKARK